MNSPNPLTLEENDKISFFQEIDNFLDKTTEYVHVGMNPGDYYKAIWTRDASYILKDQFLTGDTYNVFGALYFIWTHQIRENDNQSVIYGRGSPALGFSVNHATGIEKKRFEGALPSTIYHDQGFSEVYGQNPDIDSTALMISTTAWILDVYLKAGLYSYHENLSDWSSYTSRPYDATNSAPPPESAKTLSLGDQVDGQDVSSATAGQSPRTYQRFCPPENIPRPTELIEFLVSRLLDAINYLEGRDVDNDGLLEQGHNEDWMDTALRAGKIVYSQACWILALTNFASLLFEIGENALARRMTAMAERTVDAVENNLWSETQGSYIDQYGHGTDQQRACRTNDNIESSKEDKENEDHILTQDVSLYLVSVTENTLNDILSICYKNSKHADAMETDQNAAHEISDGKDLRMQQDASRIPRLKIQRRAESTLAAIKQRIWIDNGWPLVTDKALRQTGPWVLEPDQYHNHTFWPWITGIEMLARSRFGRYQECNALLQGLTKESQAHTLAYYEWVNPKTGKGNGAFPFRTGISTIRIALTDILISHL